MNKFKIKISDTGEVISTIDFDNLPDEYNSNLWQDAIAVEDMPIINKYERIKINYNLDTVPIEVTYQVVEKTVQEYQKELILSIGQQYAHGLITQICSQFIDHTTVFDATVASNVKLQFNATIEQLLLLNTFEELDQFFLTCNL